MRYEHDEQEEFPHFTVRPMTLSLRQISRRLTDIRARLQHVKTDKGRERLLADYTGFSSRDR